MSLQQTIDEIKRNQIYANEDVESGPRETLAGRRGRKNNAVEKIKQLRRSYRLGLLDSAAFVIVTGSMAKEFESVVTQNFRAFSANPTEFYEDLANRIPASLYQGRESMVNLFDIVGRHLYDKAMELDLTAYNELIFKQEHYVSVKNKGDLTKLLEKAINAQMGAEIVGIQAIASVLDKAIEKNHAKTITPIILVTDDDKLAITLDVNLRRLKTRGGVHLVISGKGNKELRSVPGVITVKDPSEENIKECLEKIEGVVESKKERK